MLYLSSSLSHSPSIHLQIIPEPKLFPDDSSVIADRVGHFSDLLGSINVRVVSYGSIYHRHLTVDSQVSPLMTKEKVRGKLPEKKLSSLVHLFCNRFVLLYLAFLFCYTDTDVLDEMCYLE